MKDKNDISNIHFTFTTQQIFEATVNFAENSEADVDKESISSRRIGRLLGKLRFQKSRESGKGTRQWVVTLKEMSHWTGVYNLETPGDLKKLLEKQTKPTVDGHAAIVTNVTDEKTSQTPLSFYQEYAIVLRLPGDSKFPTIANQWRRLPEVFIEAGYQIHELVMALTVFLGKAIDASTIERMAKDQVRERLAAITGGRVIRYWRKVKTD